MIQLPAFMNQSPGAGGSKPLLALGADGRRYWVKPIKNPQGPMVPVNEQIVARCGELIGAPTCSVKIVEIPQALGGMISGVRVEPGLAHGSLDVADTVNERRLVHRSEDDNQRRHAGLFALHDWCWGSDSQWLFALSDERKTYSHDHGHFFPGGPNWPSGLDEIRTLVDDPHCLQDDAPSADPAGLDTDALRELADALDKVGSDDLVRILTVVPPEWPVADADLDLLGFFLEARAPQVAGRLRLMIGGG